MFASPPVRGPRMSSEQANFTPQPSDARGRAALSFAFKTARVRLRWLSIWPALIVGFIAGTVCAAAWVLLVRYTLFDIPAWPAALMYSFCVVASCVWSLRKPLTESRAARFLDSQLSLDERITTFLELRRSRKAPGHVKPA